MQPNTSAKFNSFRIAQKEIALFFSSPLAYLFIGAFVAITLFIFFWAEAFFQEILPMFVLCSPYVRMGAVTINFLMFSIDYEVVE